MRAVEYKIETLDFTRNYSVDKKEHLASFNKLLAKMSAEGWIYKEELRLEGKEFIYAYIFFRYEQAFLDYNKEVINYIKQQS